MYIYVLYHSRPLFTFQPKGLSWSKPFRFSVVDSHHRLSNLDPTWSLQVPLRVCNSDTLLHSLQVFQLLLAWWKGCMHLICPWKLIIKCNICKVSGEFRLGCLDICSFGSLIQWSWNHSLKDADLPGCHLYSGSAASSNAPLRAQLHVLVLTSIHLMIVSVCLAVCGMLSTVFTSCSHLTAKDGSLGFCHFWGRQCSSLFLLLVECTLLRSALRDVVQGKPVLLSVRCFPHRFLVARKQE